MTNTIKTHGAFIFAVLVIILVLGGFIYSQEAILREGETVILKTRPIDPRDFLRGEYVVLNYEIGRSTIVTKVADELPDGALVFVKLGKNEEGVARVREASIKKPSSFKSELWIVGEVEYGRVHFPTLEQYFVPEGAGMPIEEMLEDIYVEVKIKNGKARVNQLLDADLQPIDPKLLLDTK